MSQRTQIQDLLHEFAATFDSEVAAKSLLDRAGVPRERIQPFGQVAPLQFWESVNRELEKGLTSNGLTGLLQAAAAIYPHNPHFQRALTAVADWPAASRHTRPEARKEVDPAYDVYLAYNKVDEAQVAEVAQGLRDRGLHPWFDVWELPPGSPVAKVHDDALRQIHAAAIFVGSAGMGPWHSAQYFAALKKAVDKQHRLIPVLLPGAKKPKLPPFLASYGWVEIPDLNDRVPLAQLEWGITGVRPADLSRATRSPIETKSGPSAKRSNASPDVEHSLATIGDAASVTRPEGKGRLAHSERAYRGSPGCGGSTRSGNDSR